MTVDFSDWVRAWDAYQQAAGLPPMPVMGLLVIYAGGFLVVCGLVPDGDVPRFDRVRDGVGFALAFAGLVVAIAGMFTVPSASPDSFTTVAQERFHVDHLVCDPACPTSGLPDDGTKVAWLDDGRNMEGRLVVHGMRVTLAPDATEVG